MSDAEKEVTPMLPMNTTPLNERLIRVLIEEHQAEIRRCFASRPDGGRAHAVVRLLNLLRRRHRTGIPAPRWGTIPQVRERT